MKEIEIEVKEPHYIQVILDIDDGTDENKRCVIKYPIKDSMFFSQDSVEYTFFSDSEMRRPSKTLYHYISSGVVIEGMGQWIKQGLRHAL